MRESELKLAMLISGGGTTMEAIGKACNEGGPLHDLVKPVVVIASRDGIEGIVKAEKLGIPVITVLRRYFPKGEEGIKPYGEALLEVLYKYQPDVVTLNGFLAQVSADAITTYERKIFNQHPGPVPEFGGEGMFARRVHAAVLIFNRLTHRQPQCTEVIVQRVHPQYDQGAVVKLAQVTIMPIDTVIDSPLARLQRLAGQDLSATNIEDIDSGVRSVRLFAEPAAVVIKHNTPLIEAFKETKHGQMDIVAAPTIEDSALELLPKVGKRTGIYTFAEITQHTAKRMLVRFVDGGGIIQTENDPESSLKNWRVVTEKQPTHEQLKQMRVAWKFIARIRSNAVAVIDAVLPMTRGIGTGQTSRVLATRIALERAGEHTHGAILASDSFFPFPDSARLAGKRGIAAIIQQGGSVNDQASIDVANELGMAMVITGQRLFWH